MALFTAVSDYMPVFKRFLDIAQPGELDALSRRFPAFGYYATVLTSITAAICDGVITVPK